MLPRRRRRLDRLLVVAVALVAAAVAVVGSLAADTERIASYYSATTVDDSGAVTVTETIDYDFGTSQDRHGIYRDVDGLSLEADPEVSASSPDAPDQVQITGDRIRIGDPAVTIGGRHRYEIGYHLGGAPVGVDGADGVDGVGGVPAANSAVRNGQLSVDVVGDRWEVPLHNVEAHVVGPTAYEDPQCSLGTTGDFGGCEVDQVEPGHLVVTADDLAARQGITVSAQLGETLDAVPAPPSAPAPPADDSPAVLVPALLAAVVALVLAAGASLLTRRAGTEEVAVGGAADAAFAMPAPPDGYSPDPSSTRRADIAELAELATIEFSPPKGITPAQGGVLLTETVEDDHKVAWLIDEAANGAVELDGSGDDLTMTWEGGNSAGVNPVLLWMFDGRQQVALGSYDQSFATGWKRLGSQLESWRHSSGLWASEGESRVTMAKVGGFLGALAGLGLVFLGQIIGWLVVTLVGAAIAGVAGGLVFTAWELRRRTAQGTGLWLQTESFRRFLAESEAEHADWAARHGLLRQYTAWAVAVGEVDRWTSAVRSSTVAPTTDMTAVHLAMMAPMLGSATSSAATAPSSSGGAGGFGGGVGGGIGGGGGGSW